MKERDQGAMDIVVFGSFGPTGGVQKCLALMIPHWVRLGFRVELVLFRGGQLFQEDELAGLVTVVSIPTRRKLATVILLARYLRHRRPRVVLSSARIANLINVAANLLVGNRRKAVVCVTSPPGRSGSEVGRWSRRRRAKQRWMKWLYPYTRGIIAISEGVKEELVGLVGLPEENIEVVYNGVLSPAIRNRAMEPTGHPWLTDVDAPVILSAGRLAREKDYSTLIRAFARLRLERSARLLILGEGPERAALQDLVDQLDLGDSVALPGYKGNPYAYMVGAHLFVMSSLWEGFGNVIAEALCLGTPVVATNCPVGPREILGDGQWGRLVEPGDVAGLAATMRASLDEARFRSPALVRHCKRFEADYAAMEYLRVMGLMPVGPAANGTVTTEEKTP